MDFLLPFADVYTLDHIKFLLEGFWVTLKVAAVSIVLSFIIGGLIGTLRYTRIPVVTQILTAIVETIRNLPLLLIIFFTYFALPEIGIEMKITTAAIAALTVFESAMISEIIRSGLNSIEKGQIEAARASGLNYIQTLRYIVLPQALKRMVPPIVSQFISLLKDTSLAVVIALPDLLHNGQIIYAQKESYVIPVMVIVSLMYFIVNYVLSLVARRLEIKQS